MLMLLISYKTKLANEKLGLSVFLLKRVSPVMLEMEIDNERLSWPVFSEYYPTVNIKFHYCLINEQKIWIG